MNDANDSSEQRQIHEVTWSDIDFRLQLQLASDEMVLLKMNRDHERVDRSALAIRTHLLAKRRDALIPGALEALELEAVAAIELVVALLPPAEPSRERARPAGRTFGGEFPMQVQHRELGRATRHRASGPSHAALDALNAALRLRFVPTRLRAAATAVGARATRPARFDRVRARPRLLATLALARRLAAACVNAA